MTKVKYELAVFGCPKIVANHFALSFDFVLFCFFNFFLGFSLCIYCYILFDLGSDFMARLIPEYNFCGIWVLVIS